MVQPTYRPPGLEPADIAIVVLYFLVVLGIGIYAMYKSNRGTVSGYFLAGRFMTWIPVGASLFASNIGSEHFVGLAGSGAAGGIGVGAFEFNALILLQLLGWMFLPVYIASGICTLPEYICRRYGGQRLRVWLSVVSLLLYIFTKISVNLFSGALFIRLALGWNLYLAILLMLGMTCLCTITGGLTAVIYTDTLCTFLMVVGSLTVMGLGFAEVGGYDGLKEKYMVAVANETLYSNSSCGWPRDDAFVMLRDPVNSDMPWAGFIFGQTIASIWYWCADQVIVQRALAAKSLSHAQGACLLAGYIKILPLFTLVIPGMISRVISPDRVACSSPETCMAICGSEAGCSNIAYPELVLKLMPTGLRGLMMAVMMAALMSDLTSIFNSASTLFTIDVYGRFREKASVRELMIVGRIMVAVMTGIGILWIPVVQNVQGGQLFIYIQAVSAYFSPPIAALYLISILWTKATEKLANIQFGLRGLMMAVMMAALMSDLTSIFNSASTLFTIDVYGRFREKASVRELMIVGRIMVAVMTGIGILWIPVVQNVQGGQLFIYIQAVSAYFSPPIAALYLISILWTKATEKGAFWGMVVGFIVGAIRMILDFTHLEPRCGEEDTRPAIIAKVHYMYFALLLFWITVITVVVVSLFTKPMEEANVARLTWWTRHDAPSTTDKMETARDEEIEMMDVSSPTFDDAEVEMGEEKGTSDQTPAVVTKTGAEESKMKRLYSWFCGYEAGTTEAKKAAKEQHERLTVITSLEQHPYAETFLNVNVIVILCIGLFLYLFFSIK